MITVKAHINTRMATIIKSLSILVLVVAVFVYMPTSFAKDSSKDTLYKDIVVAISTLSNYESTDKIYTIQIPAIPQPYIFEDEE